MFGRALLMLSLTIMLAACDGEKSKEIVWQLPLSVPHDPHASGKGNQLPEWATLVQGSVNIVFLQKSTARTFAVDVTNGDEVGLQHWQLHLQGIAYGLRIKDNVFINDATVDNPAAFVSLYRDGALEYEGWLYKDFPELFGIDNSDWKIWLNEVSMPPSSQEGDNMLP